MIKDRQKITLPFDGNLLKRRDIANEFRKLIDTSDCTEMDVKPFLEHYPCVIPTPWILNHQVHFSFMFPQFAVYTGNKTDFTYLTKSSNSWWCVLVEFESPKAQLFHEKAKSVKLHSQATRALDQIRDWQDHLSTHSSEFLNRLEPVRRPLARNRVEFRYVLVIGRRAQFEKDSRKRSRFSRMELGTEFPHLRVFTYDSLLSDFESRPMRDFDLLVPSGTRYKFKKYVPRRATFWDHLTTSQLQLSPAQLSKAKKVGILADEWNNGKKLHNLGNIVQGSEGEEFDPERYEKLNVRLKTGLHWKRNTRSK